MIEARHVDLLKASAIPIPLAERVGVRSMCGDDTWTAGFGEKAGPALAFPYRDISTGKRIDGFLRIRLDNPNGSGRYLQPAGSKNRLYLPVATPEDLKDRSRSIIITEGERKGLALAAWCERQKRDDAVIAIGGVCSWRTAIKGELADGTLGKVASKPIDDLDAITWTDRRTVIAFDSDSATKPDVARAERALARELESRGAIVHIARIPPGPGGEKIGADDLLFQHGDEVVAEVIDAAARWSIVIGTDAPRVVDEAERALVLSGGIYSRSRLLVEVHSTKARRLDWLTRAPGAPAIMPIEAARLRECMADSATWIAVTKKGKREPALPPSTFVDMLMARPAWSFPELVMISETPMLRPDGTVIQTAGYDDLTGVLYIPRETFPQILDEPTQKDAQGAINVLVEPLSDFPFTEASDRSAALAAMLTLIGRTATPGPAPAFAIDAPVQASGKTLLADIISTTGTGRPASKMSAPADEAEASKRLLAIAIEGLPIVVIDNLTGVLQSASLAAALTATEWRDRLLGYNKTITAPLITIWMVTGNNLVFGSDIARRVIPIRLDPKMERPEERTGFVHADLRAWTLTERPRLVAAALTVLRAFCIAGRPAHGNPRMGSFEAWDDLVRGALVWAGEPDPLEGRERVRAEADTEGEALRVALAVWHETFGPEAVTAAAAVEKAKDRPELQTALAELAGVEPAKLSGRCLGYAIKRVQDRIAGGLAFKRTEKTTHGATWWTVTGEGEGL